MQLFSKFFLLVLFMLGVGKAHAILLQIELTGDLTYGYQNGLDTFGVGSTDLTGLEANFRYTIDTDAPHYSNGDGYYIERYSGSVVGMPFALVKSSLTINNITRSVVGNYSSFLFMREDQYAPSGNGNDFLEVSTRDTGYDHSDTTTTDNYISLYAYDFVMSILEGLDLNQLDGWSVTNPYQGVAYFGFRQYRFDNTTSSYIWRENTYGNIYLNRSRVIWGGGLNVDPHPVSEPGSLAIFGAALGLLATVRRRARH